MERRLSPALRTAKRLQLGPQWPRRVRNNPAFPGIRDKIEKLPADWTELRLRRFFQGLLCIEAAAIEKFEGALYFIAFRTAQIRPAQTEDVDAVNRILGRTEKRRQILREAAFRHDQATHSNPLMKTRAAADERPVVDPDMSRQQSVVRDHDAVSQFAIVAEVCPDHEEIAVAEDGRAPLNAAAMDRAVLANHIAIPKFNRAFRCRIKAQILRSGSDHCAVADEISGANFHRSFDDDVRLNDALFSDNGARGDNRARTDLHLSADLGARLDNRRRMNLHRTPASLKLK